MRLPQPSRARVIYQAASISPDSEVSREEIGTWFPSCQTPSKKAATVADKLQGNRVRNIEQPGKSATSNKL